MGSSATLSRRVPATKYRPAVTAEASRHRFVAEHNRAVARSHRRAMRSTSRLFRLGVSCSAPLPVCSPWRRSSPPRRRTGETIERRYNENNLSDAAEDAGDEDTSGRRNAAKWGRPAFLGTFTPHFVPPLRLQNTIGLPVLIRNGNLYLSLHDTILLAVENNLDVEQQRYQIAMADTDVVRAQGGGAVRGLPLTVRSRRSASAVRVARC